jgi:hypothetical protein
MKDISLVHIAQEKPLQNEGRLYRRPAVCGFPKAKLSSRRICPQACALGLAVWCLSSLPVQAGFTNSWRVLSADVPLGTNTVLNPDMETTSSSPPLANWKAYGPGYTATTGTAHSGTNSMQCSTTNATDAHGAYQTIVLNQTTPQILKLSGWSKAQGVTSSSDKDYSIYLDITYTNGTYLYGQTVNFSVGTHDWEYKEAQIIPAMPIKQINCYLLFRNSHTGTVWFDDITVAQYQGSQFDGSTATPTPPSPLPFNPATQFTLLSGDGLQLKVTQDGGVIEGVAQGSTNLMAAGMDYASGWFVCDRAATSDWWNVGGWVTSADGTLQQHGVITNLNLSADVCYSVTNNAIRMQATVSNLVAPDRAITLYFVLPVNMDGGYWWNSPRDRVSVSQAQESATFSSAAMGARNVLSSYPLATVATSAALTLAVPPDQYRPFRLVYNQVTRQLFAAFDVGLSAVPINFPQCATVELWLYGSDPAWGLRSGLAGYYSRFPAAFTRTYTNEGIWVAFADLSKIYNVSDFGIGYHEIASGTSYMQPFVKSDDTNGIPTFRYVMSPWQYYFSMPTNVDNTDYTLVYSNLLSRYTQNVTSAIATLNSGLRDTNGLLEYLPCGGPDQFDWNSYGTEFFVNASPFITNSQYSITKFNNEWNSAVRDYYNHPEYGVLDGEYIDNFEAFATTPDYSSNHLRTTTFPLTYAADSKSLMTPLCFGACEMARAVGADVHALDKPIMANVVHSVLNPDLPFDIGLFDFAGTEMNCFDAAGNFVPMSDSSELYARALSGVRPYGNLLDTDFSLVTQAEMERYMRVCAFYAIYPSALSAHNSTLNYFEQPGLYGRDRPLFKKYVPIIRALSLAGWQPITDATVDNTNLGIEAYGTNAVTSTRYLTARNLVTQTTTANVTFDLSKWAYPGAQWLQLTNLFDGGSFTINLAAGSNSVPLTLQSNQCTVYAVQAGPPPRPTILMNDGNLGFRNQQFGFYVTAIPGQVVVIEGATNLGSWTALQTNLVSDTNAFYFADPNTNALPRRYYRARAQ